MTHASSRAPEAPRRVLVVDDQSDILYFLRLFLEEAGFEVEQAASGRMAIELAMGDRASAFDVAVLDVDMPEVDGVQVAAAIRACEACRHVRIVFHSALNEEEIRTRFSDYDDFLRKPSDVERMVARIRRLADTPRTK